MAEILGSTDLLSELTPAMISITELPTTSTRALVIHLADLARFPQPPPFKKATSFTWALAHGTTISGAQHILAEGVIRPANWTYRTNLAKCELPTFGAYYLGRMIPNDLQYPDWTKKELLDSANLPGKGQQRIVMGAIFRGACAHTKFKAGGNEWAQVQVAKVGVVTTSEKYTIAHSEHVGVHFIAVRWKQHSEPEDEDSSSDDCTYRKDGKTKRPS